MTTSRFNRRDFLTTVAGSSLVYAFDAPAQTAPRTSITVRIARDLAVLDPAHRTGPWEGNVMRVVFQRLMTQKPNSSELELDAAAEVKQVSPTVIEFRLKPGQMFTDGYGEMTADDVKFSFERIGLPPKDGAKESSYKKDWLHLQGVEVKSKYEGRIVLARPRANLFDVVIADGSGCIVSRKAVERARRGLRDTACRLRVLPAGRRSSARRAPRCAAIPRMPGASRTSRRSPSARSPTRGRPISRCVPAKSTSPCWRRPPPSRCARSPGSRSATSPASPTSGSA